MSKPTPTEALQAAVVATSESITSRFLNAARNVPALTPQIELDEAGSVKEVRWLTDAEVIEEWGSSARRLRE